MSDEPENKAKAVTKTVSLPNDLLDEAMKKVGQDPELDFSKYVRGLIRKDLANAEVAA